MARTFTIDTPTIEIRFALTSSSPPTGVFSWQLSGIEPFANTAPQFLYSLTFLFPEMIQLLDDQPVSKVAAMNEVSEFLPKETTSSNKLSSQALLDGYDFHIINFSEKACVMWRFSDSREPSPWVSAIVNRADLETVSRRFSKLYTELVTQKST